MAGILYVYYKRLDLSLSLTEVMDRFVSAIDHALAECRSLFSLNAIYSGECVLYDSDNTHMRIQVTDTDVYLTYPNSSRIPSARDFIKVVGSLDCMTDDIATIHKVKEEWFTHGEDIGPGVICPMFNISEDEYLKMWEEIDCDEILRRISA